MNRLTNPIARPTLEVLEDRDVPSTLAAEFPGHGVWSYASGTWQQLTTNNASQVAADAGGDVVAEFPGQGVWLFSGGTWQQITANNASGLAIGYSTGINDYKEPFGYRMISVVAEFPGQGLWSTASPTTSTASRTTPTGSELTANNAATEAIDGNGHVVRTSRPRASGSTPGAGSNSPLPTPPASPSAQPPSSRPASPPTPCPTSWPPRSPATGCGASSRTPARSGSPLATPRRWGSTPMATWRPSSRLGCVELHRFGRRGQGRLGHRLEPPDRRRRHPGWHRRQRQRLRRVPRLGRLV